MRVVKMDKTYHKEVLNFFGEDLERYYFIISDLLKKASEERYIFLH